MPNKIPPVRGQTTNGSFESFPKDPSIKIPQAMSLSPKDHRITSKDGSIPLAVAANKLFVTSDDAKYIKSAAEHFIYDPNDPALSGVAPYTVDANGANPIPTFSGSATHYNPLDNPDMREIGESTYSEYVTARLPKGQTEAPVSPLYPFIRMDPVAAQRATLASYNRFHIPVSDNEFRKAFRHIFITRPECYVCCADGGLSDQAAYDEDFSSAYSRMPYLCELLSPSYISKISFTSDREDAEIQANWNFLLSNRVTGMSSGNIDIGVLENITKSIPGYTVTTPSFLGGMSNGTLDLTFRDTKNLEVSEFIRLWLLYMHKRHAGIFSPPYNGYQRTNGFFGKGLSSQQMSGAQYWMMHPYDRAIEYPCTIFDIITDEADSKILYMCTYIGAYPAGLSSPLTNENNAPITDAKVSVSFRYQCKIENKNTCMALFNYNAGLTDHIGRPVSWAERIQEVLPILIQAEDVANKNSFALGNYIGAAGMFTGSPYIVIGKSQRHPFTDSSKSPDTIDGSGFLYRPYLKFMPLNAPELVDKANLNMQHVQRQFTGEVVSISQDTNDYSTNDEELARLANQKVQEMNLAEEEARRKAEEAEANKGFLDKALDFFDIDKSDLAEAAAGIGVLGALVVGGPIAAAGVALAGGLIKENWDSISSGQSRYDMMTTDNQDYTYPNGIYNGPTTETETISEPEPTGTYNGPTSRTETV